MIRTVYIVHHSHTDIGYTHGQGRIVRWHGQYIRQAMKIASRRDDFAWLCETFHPVEVFWEGASSVEREQFVRLARAGRIGLSGNYLNYTELADQDVLQSLASRARTFVDANGLALRGAMTADINGTSLTHARALADAGVELLVTFMHPHHGYVPFARRSMFYDWDLGDGRSIAVVHADHYHVGNELGFVPWGGTNYCWGWGGESSYPWTEGLLDSRLPRYLKRIEQEGWDADWFVVAASGVLNDNGPPGEHLADRIARWNAAHPEIDVRMVTLDTLAQAIRSTSRPRHAGDCPDWWADGVAGDPEAVALYRHAQRQRRLLVDLAAHTPAASVDLSRLDTTLALFAEHTFGHSGSVRHPSNLTAHQLRTRKLGFAGEAADLAETLLDTAVEAIGCGPMHTNRPLVFRAINPSDRSMKQLVSIVPEWFDEYRWLVRAEQCRVVRVSDGKVVPHQVIHTYRGGEIVVDLALDPGQTTDLKLEALPSTPFELSKLPPVPDRSHDIVGMSELVARTNIRTKHVEIDFDVPNGISAWRDARGASLLDPRADVLPFTLRSSRLHRSLDGDSQCDARRRLGRNRNGVDAVWSTSRLKRIRGSSDGPHAQVLDLEYDLIGCEVVHLRLIAHHATPRVDVELAMHKTGTWDAENVYLSLPFTPGSGHALHVDRGAGPMKPGVDQLPGTLIDYLALQEGLAWTTPHRGLAIAQRDSHLLQLGPLVYGERQLATGEPVFGPVYAWLMTNYWETNFTPELGGFYSFRYSVLWGESLRDPASALQSCRDANAGVQLFRLAAP
jgi:hypothetical protein